MCWEYIDIIASNIPKWKSKQLVSELLDSTYRGSPKNAGVYLEISFGLFDHKEIPGLSRTLFKFQDFPGLVGTIIIMEHENNTGDYIKEK